MCLIIFRPEGGSNVPNAVLDHNKRKNPDGFGIAWRVDGILNYEKFGPKDYDAFHALLKEIDKTKVEYAAHFRLATHGPVNQEMSHPFVYEDEKDGEVAIFHNGIIPIDAPKEESDTSQFVKAVLSKLVPRWWKKGAYKFLVEQSMGWSRLLVMTDKETVRLEANAGDWKQQGGIWYSTEPGPWQAPRVVKAPSSAATDDACVYGRAAYSGKGYTPPSEWLDPDEDYEAEYEKYEKYVEPVSQSGWKDHGHWVEPITENQDALGDIEGEVVCTTCNGYGDYYRIDGQFFFDVGHLDMDEDSLSELSKPQQQLLLPAPVNNMPLLLAGQE